MKNRTKKTTKKSANNSVAALDFDFDGFVSHIQLNSVGAKRKSAGRTSTSSSSTSASTASAPTGHIFVVGLDDRNLVRSLLEKHVPAWQLPGILQQLQKEVLHFAGVSGPVWIFCKKRQQGPVSHNGRLEDTEYSWHRDQAGSVLGYAKAYRVGELKVELHATDDEQEVGFFVGLELASYTYKGQVKSQTTKAQLHSDQPIVRVQKINGEFDEKNLQRAAALGVSTNLARHMVNSPPNLLNPTTMADFVTTAFRGRKNIKTEVWDSARLEKEGMGLILGVGQGSPTPPCMIHLRYRPTKAGKRRPMAFVGKGVTFDTGGLDIKPSSNMRLMKKDMGGVASLVGFAHWLAEAQPSIPVDIYLGLAENSVDGLSMRPSDVLTARNGMTVEIHNTDAEGRLVLADCLDVAVSQTGANEPDAVIDVATLTGAIKAGLGGEIGGLFANSDGLADDINWSGYQAGEPNWRMPLFSRYGRGMESNFADVVNCLDGFGGAITAALFLEKFVRNKPWAHLDIYGWNDKPNGGLTFAGGNGQPVQTMAKFILGMEK